MSISSLVRSAWLVLLVGAAFGCSSDPDPEPAKECNSLSLDGPEVTPMEVAQGTTPAGGVIEDGHYVQTGYDYYADPGATVFGFPINYKSTFEFTQGAVQVVVAQVLDGDEHSQRLTATYQPSGTVLDLTYSCPESGVMESPGYSATPGEVRLFYRIADDLATAEIILTKR